MRLKLFDCMVCGWRGQTYARPEFGEIECPECGAEAPEIHARLVGGKLEPVSPGSKVDGE